ncbi:uncharacterized protein EV420DRAFT_523676 [Desarmillaria tabescens]|uniref:Transmembrane protein n=1 Tax=Armillaria tabescens TaxID=1929756 RepID=A0AA39KCD7_ARMTA|nr:uncharacterized protein EV420DRAFT_523676 [Desarmillaria tabescens]KAK0457380.1 hypothetical protein EV420DRAFT_523676 [Desarmillaria tabescens]
MVFNSALLLSVVILFLVSLYKASISASDVSWGWVGPSVLKDVPLPQIVVADVITPVVFETMDPVTLPAEPSSTPISMEPTDYPYYETFFQPPPPGIPPNVTRSLSSRRILKACSLSVFLSALSAIGVVFKRVFKPSHGHHSASTSVSKVLRSAVSGSSARTLFLALIFVVTVTITLGLLIVQSLVSESDAATFNVLWIVLFVHVGMTGIYVLVSALWDILERCMGIEESVIGQGEVAAAEDISVRDHGERDIGSLTVSNLQALTNMAPLPSESFARSSSSMYMSTRSTDGEHTFGIPEAQATSSTGNTPSEQNGGYRMTVGESGIRSDIPDCLKSAIPSESSDHVSRDLYTSVHSSIGRTPLFDKLRRDLAGFEEDLETVSFLIPLLSVADGQKNIPEVPSTSSSVPTVVQEPEETISNLPMGYSLPERPTNPVLRGSSSESSGGDDEEISTARPMERPTNPMLRDLSSSDGCIDENMVVASAGTPVPLPSLIPNVSQQLGNKDQEVEETVMDRPLERRSNPVLGSTSEALAVTTVRRPVPPAPSRIRVPSQRKAIISVAPVQRSGRSHTPKPTCSRIPIPGRVQRPGKALPPSLPSLRPSERTAIPCCSPFIAPTTCQRDESGTAARRARRYISCPKNP